MKNNKLKCDDFVLYFYECSRLLRFLLHFFVYYTQSKVFLRYVQQSVVENFSTTTTKITTLLLIQEFKICLNKKYVQLPLKNSTSYITTTYIISPFHHETAYPKTMQQKFLLYYTYKKMIFLYFHYTKFSTTLSTTKLLHYYTYRKQDKA